MILRALSTLALALPSALIAQDAAAPEKRTLVFHRPEVKGAKYELTSKASLTSTTDFHLEYTRGRLALVGSKILPLVPS